MAENEDTPHKVNLTIFPFLWIMFILLMTAWLWLFNKARLRTSVVTSTSACQTDAVCDHNIVVVHPNNEIDLTHSDG